jgi:hypothetical protein
MRSRVLVTRDWRASGWEEKDEGRVTWRVAHLVEVQTEVREVAREEAAERTSEGVENLVPREVRDALRMELEEGRERTGMEAPAEVPFLKSWGVEGRGKKLTCGLHGLCMVINLAHLCVLLNGSLDDSTELLIEQLLRCPIPELKPFLCVLIPPHHPGNHSVSVPKFAEVRQVVLELKFHTGERRNLHGLARIVEGPSRERILVASTSTKGC